MIDFIKDADCTKETPVKLGVPDAPIYGKGIKLKPICSADHGFADDIKAAPYEDTGMTAKYGNGYISAFCYSEDFDWLFLPGEFNGNTALPVGDHCWNQNGTGWRVAILGAGWYHGLYAGAFSWHLYFASSFRTRSIGGRLVYRKKVAA